MIRYHSFYPWHRENQYQNLMNESDKEQLHAVRAFNRESPFVFYDSFTWREKPLTMTAYDLYSKSDEPPSVEKLKPYYMGLIQKYFPEEIEW
jgi:inositol oxygenase